MNFFGTDGIRGTYGSTIFDRTAFLLGKSLAIDVEKPLVVIARDTRESGAYLRDNLASGVYSEGGNVIDLGILPTNAVSLFVRKYGADFGVMVSASHNPPQDNGLKVFDKYGIKLCKNKQLQLSATMSRVKPRNTGGGVDAFDQKANSVYCNEVTSRVDVDMQGLPVFVDCGHGAGSSVAKQILSCKNANVTCFFDGLDGKNINVGCGATHPQTLAQLCKSNGVKLGFSLDGDADRLVVVEDGVIVDGNALLFALARYLKERGDLCCDTVVGTTVTNGGLDLALQQIGCRLVRSDVGDANVFQLMKSNGYSLGGEDSGHVIFGKTDAGSDALITALWMCKIYREKGSILGYSNHYVPLPTAKTSVPVPIGVNLDAVSRRVSALFPEVRIVLRKSGTENVVRVYTEGLQCKQALQSICLTLEGNN